MQNVGGRAGGLWGKVRDSATQASTQAQAMLKVSNESSTHLPRGETGCYAAPRLYLNSRAGTDDRTAPRGRRLDHPI
jgi:hypothetical protein